MGFWKKVKKRIKKAASKVRKAYKKAKKSFGRKVSSKVKKAYKKFKSKARKTYSKSVKSISKKLKNYSKKVKKKKTKKSKKAGTKYLAAAKNYLAKKKNKLDTDVKAAAKKGTAFLKSCSKNPFKFIPSNIILPLASAISTGKIISGLIKEERSNELEPAPEIRSKLISETDSKSKLTFKKYIDDLKHISKARDTTLYGAFLAKIGETETGKNIAALGRQIDSSVSKLSDYFPQKIQKAFKTGANLVGLDSINKVLFKKDLYTGATAAPSKLDYLSAAAALIPLPTASLGKLGSKLGITGSKVLINSVDDVAVRGVTLAVKSPILKGVVASTTDDVIKAIGKGALLGLDDAVRAGAGIANTLKTKLPTAGISLFKKFGKLVTSPKITVPLMGAMLVSQLDVLGWGFKLFPGNIKDKLDSTNKDLRSVFYNIDQAVKDGRPEDAKTLLSGAKSSLESYDKTLNGLPTKFWNTIGFDFDDKEAALDNLENTYAVYEDKLEEFTEPEVPAAEVPEEINGICTTVYDADTIKIDGKYKIRMVGIDAPESGTPAGISSSRYLSSLILNKTVTVKVDPLNKLGFYGRILGVVFLDGENINLLLAELGKAKLFFKGRNKYVDPEEWKAAVKAAQTTTEKLKISSKPTGAVIYLDNLQTNRYTSETFTIPAGIHIVELHKEGYKRYFERIKLEVGSPVEILAELEEEDLLTGEGSISISTSPEINAYIYIDGVYVNKKTPAVIPLLEGSYNIAGVKKGYVIKDQTVEVKQEVEDSIFLDAIPVTETEEEKAKAIISVNSFPDKCNVFLNNIYTGKKSPTLLSLDPGTYILRLEKPKYVPVQVEIEVEAGEEAPVELKLNPIEEEKNPVIYVNSIPTKAKIYIDNLYTGKSTPHYFSIDPGVHIIKVGLKGYMPAEKTIDVQPL